jgi:hypothetical protein
VERENGPDDILDDVRNDIFIRFKEFREWISDGSGPRVTAVREK